MALPELVIFDCDGVLVDSEPISIEVLVETIAEAGVRISSDTAYSEFLGRSMSAVAGILSEDYNLTITDEHLKRIRALLYARFEKRLTAVNNIAAALEKLNVPFCVASSSQPDRIRLSLKITGLLEYFEPRIYSSSMVEKGKPAPDLFLFASQSQGVRADRCVVVEDSPAGIEAAKRAGMRVFAFTGASHAGPARLRARVAALAPDVIFDDMSELPGLVAGANWNTGS